MLLRIFQGSKPIAASTTPTRIDSRTSRNATVSGEPPRKRYRPSWAAGNSLVSFGIDGLPRGFARSLQSSTQQGRWGTRLLASMAVCRRIPDGSAGFQHPLQRLQPVGLARRLVPAQPVDARKPHRHAGFVPRRALQALESDFQHQPLVRLVNDMAHRSEFFDCVAADETVDLQQFLVGEAEIGLA